MPLKARASNGTWIDVATKGLDNIAGNADDINIATGPDRVLPGQLIMLEKGSYTVLLQVTSVDTSAGRIAFAAGDSLNLNVHTAASGSVAGTNGLNNWAPAPDLVPETTPVARTTLHTTATRVRMITYYIDATDPVHPKLVRRLNNGHETSFNNNSGSVVAFDVENLKISFDMADGKTNPAGVTFVAGRLRRRRAVLQRRLLADPGPQGDDHAHRPLEKEADRDEPVFPQHADHAGGTARHGIRQRLRPIGLRSNAIAGVREQV